VSDEQGYHQLWDVSSGKRLAASVGHQIFPLQQCGFSQNGKYYLLFDMNKISVWQCTTGKHIINLNRTHVAEPTEVISPHIVMSDNLLGMKRDHCTIDFWTLDNQAPSYTNTTIPSIWGMALTQDGKRIFTVEEAAVTVWDAQTGQYLTLFSTNTGSVREIFLQDDSLVLAYDQALYFYRNRRPEHWWGVFYLPEFWITTILSILLLFNLYRNFKRARESA
jgi:WD40 repeat protein